MENEKQTPFLKRVSDLEKEVKFLKDKLNSVIKSLRR